jgi:hypothetical protein
MKKESSEYTRDEDDMQGRGRKRGRPSVDRGSHGHDVRDRGFYGHDKRHAHDDDEGYDYHDYDERDSEDDEDTFFGEIKREASEFGRKSGQAVRGVMKKLKRMIS